MADLERKRWPVWQIAAGTVALGLVAWGLFHPDFRPDPQLVGPSIREELAKTGFKATQGAIAAEFQNVESEEGVSENAVTRQKIAPIDALVTEKRGRRYWKAATEENSGLYVGPITVVRMHRIWPPIVGNLLPYSFWASSRMSDFRVEEHHDFPHARGGRLVAKVTYEDRNADGQHLQTERRRLRCDVKDVVDAVSIHAGLSGSAALIECSESLDGDGRRVGAGNPETLVVGHVRFAHWYVIDRGWSIPLEGEYGMRVAGAETVRKWKAKLISFD